MSSFLPIEDIAIIPNVSTRTIGDFSGYVSIEENSVDELEITQHPVQRGASITDHAYKNPATVSIRFIKGSDDGTPLNQLYQQLIDLQASRELFSVITGKRAYSNMLFKSLNLTTDINSDTVLSVTGTFQQVFLVDTQTTNVPPRSNQKIPEKTDSIDNKGDKQASPVNPNSTDQSLLDKIGESSSGLFG